MKKLLFLLSVLSITLLSSCSIYEEIYFEKDGQVSYNMTLDMSEMLAMVPPEKMTSMPADSTISFAEMIKEKVDMDTLSSMEIEDLKNIMPFYLSTKMDAETKSATISIYGKFSSAEDLNKGFMAMKRMASKNEGKMSGLPQSNDLMNTYNTFNYSWDGKTMRRTGGKKTSSQSEEQATSKGNEFAKLLTGGKMRVKYHFPIKVNTIDNPDALISQDGKTVIVEYKAIDLIENPEKTSIEIKLK